MKNTLLVACLSLAVLPTLQAQKLQHKEGPYVVKNSIDFKSPKKHYVANPIGYGDQGIVQVNMKKLKSFHFQQFSNDLKFQKENLVELDGKFNDHVSFNSFVKLKNKTYLFTREVFKEEKKEGITALEFSNQALNFVGSAKNLFKSSDKVQMGGSWSANIYGIPTYGFNGSMGAYDLKLSEDRSKFLYSYALVPKEKKDALNKEIDGLYIFDENLTKLWGGEYEMPYTEAKMDNLGYILADDSRVYLLARVYEGDNAKEGRKDKTKPNYHFEILVFDKNKTKPKTIQIQLDNYFPTEAWLYETKNHEIAVTGFYAKGYNKPVDGAYTVKVDVEKGTFSKLNGGYYEIPAEVIKSYLSDKQRRKIEKKEKKDEDFDIGISDLEINDIFSMEDGSQKIVAEQYYVIETYYYDSGCKCMRTKYDTYANDIFVISISKEGKLDWVQKIPKAQHAPGAYGPGISINTLKVGSDLHIFYVDNLKNFKLPVDQAPKMHQQGRGGFLTGVTVSTKGEIKKFNLGEVEDYRTNFYVREFVDGGRTNLISTERKKKKNVLYSIEINKGA